MRLDPMLRPRVLAALLGGSILVIFVIAVLFAAGPGAGYRYTPDVTSWSYGTYLLLAGILLAGLGVVAADSLHSLGSLVPAETRRVEDEPEELGADSDAWDLPDVPEPPSDPPANSGGVDRDIDELLAALETIQSSMDTRGGAVVEVARPHETAAAAVARARQAEARLVEGLKLRRSLLAAHFLGPALVNIGVLAMCAILLPGADGFLQSYNQFNTAALLALAYSWPSIALYTGLSVYAILRQA